MTHSDIKNWMENCGIREKGVGSRREYQLEENFALKLDCFPKQADLNLELEEILNNKISKKCRKEPNPNEESRKKIKTKREINSLKTDLLDCLNKYQDYYSRPEQLLLLFQLCGELSNETKISNYLINQSLNKHPNLTEELKTFIEEKVNKEVEEYTKSKLFERLTPKQRKNRIGSLKTSLRDTTDSATEVKDRAIIDFNLVHRWRFTRK